MQQFSSVHADTFDHAYATLEAGHNETDYALSTKRGIGWGAVVGLFVAIAQLAYINSPELNALPRMLVITFWCCFGWALFGFIVGGSGALAPGRSSRH